MSPPRRALSCVCRTTAQASHSVNYNNRTSRHFTSSPPSQPPKTYDFTTILSRPTWSVRSLLPPADPSSSSSTPKIPLSRLHHLLRLSALPHPPTPAAEAAMLATLESQLHFVRAIQQVDTTNVLPLSAIRDETTAGRAEQAITLDRLQPELDKEAPFGRARRPRRKRSGGSGGDDLAVDTWDVFGAAPRKASGYFVVKSRDAKPVPGAGEATP